MNKRGFTLIELLVTIALLSIIAIISFVSINKIIEKSKVNDCEILVNNIKNAASEYVSDNRYKSSFVSSVTDYTLAINASTLVNGNYLKGQIIDPFSKNEIVASDIMINLYLNNDYTLDSAVISEPVVLTNCEG